MNAETGKPRRPGPGDTDDLWKRDEVESPCVKLCALHPVEGICVGCLRTRDEIGRWSLMSQAERRAVMSTLSARAPRLRKRRGGHDGRV